jgi:diguanylate cyclase (GGDEF)-like protein/PAS domain S-box-containing protein
VTLLPHAEHMLPAWTRVRRIIGVACALPRGHLARLATLGLIALLIAMPGFAVWGAVLTYQAGAAARQATALSDAFADARYAVGAEESLERKYRLQPSAEVRGFHRDAAVSLTQALGRASAFAGAGDLTMINSVLASHVRYLAAVQRMFAAIDDGNTALTNEIDVAEADPEFDAIELHVDAAAATSRIESTDQLAMLAALQTRVLIATPIILAFGMALVVFFWTVLRIYEEQVRQAAAHEAANLQRSERRFRSIIQHASDMVLICAHAGAITYQSPAAEIAWGYAPDELLDLRLVDVIHPEEKPAADDLWQQVLDAAGMTRTTELRLRDRAGSWHDVELILTNLLHEAAVSGVVITVHDISERKAFERQLMEQAFYDSLTGLPNRALFNDRLDQARARSVRRHDGLGLLFLDLDNFKLVNDSLGHGAGDTLLVEVAKRLVTTVRTDDTVARLGGDEFVVLLERINSEADILPLAESITQQFVRPFAVDGREFAITASIGIAFSERDHEHEGSLLRNADVAMYRAKASGKGQHVLFNAGMHADIMARLELETDLRQAIERGELRIHYQPIFSLRSGRMSEVEALVRWQHPTRGLIAPADFIPIAEETGLIVPIGQWVLEQACHQAAAWHVQCPQTPLLVVGVNVSPRQLQLASFAEDVARTLRETGLPAVCLKLEVTEGVIMRDMEASAVVLGKLKALDIQLAIDDFGTGYSSLAYLKRLPLDVLKIDKSFVDGIIVDPEDRAIVKAIISLAKSLGLSITAEGIENAEQAAALNAWGCERGQGYHFAKPMEAAGIAVLLRQQNARGALAEAA